ncbi:MAG: hypothetical protein IJY23_02110 [Clostridia bacterium]|nr:hypothetical protein [Clostridia bacterium]
MMKDILGIDLGTSSVKLILTCGDEVKKVRLEYSEQTPLGWWNAICEASKSLDLSSVRGIGLSSQVGTYIIDDKAVIGWDSSIGKQELAELLSEIPSEVFKEQISMPHPSIISYPLPRIKHIVSNYPNAEKICMPKDFICERLTGNFVSDKFSWRGLANLDGCEYSKKLLSHIGAERIKLPKLCEPADLAGFVTPEASKETSIPTGTPVYLGCNDFFAGIIGMGISGEGEIFDITGTSEHLGIIEDKTTDGSDGLVSGKYFFGSAHYGVTASCGKSLKFGQSLYPLDKVDVKLALSKNPPIFLPYLSGERAPIWDPDARGAFFGINADASPHEMAYSVLEGVAFSVYHVYETMGKPKAKFITVSGGGAKNSSLNVIKSSLFGTPVRVSAEHDASALGAQLLAAVGIGDYESLTEAIEAVRIYRESTEPDISIKSILKERYEIYKSLYVSLKDEFKKLKAIGEIL